MDDTRSMAELAEMMPQSVQETIDPRSLSVRRTGLQRALELVTTDYITTQQLPGSSDAGADAGTDGGYRAMDATLSYG